MAVYTDISDEEVAGLLDRFDLGAPLSFKGIAEGVENSNFLLATETGRFFLTVYERRVDPAELPYFMDLMRWLSAAGFPCPEPVADRTGAVLQLLRGKPAALVTFLDGLSARRPTAAQCGEAGRGLGRLHAAGQGFPGRRANTLGPAAWPHLFAPLRGAAEALKPGLSAQVDGDLAAFAAAWPDDLPTGTVHADFFPDNVFFTGPADRPAFAAAFDFYFACTDHLAYDLAVTLNAWCFEADGGLNVTKARALVAGYQSVRRLTAAERDALPLLCRGAAMRFFLTRLTDWGATPAGALVRPKDPLEYERKLGWHRANARLDLFGDDPA